MIAPPPAVSRSGKGRYILLAAILAVAATAQILVTVDVVRGWDDDRAAYRLPFTLAQASRQIETLHERALRAGLRSGDEVVAVNGHAFRGMRDIGVLRSPQAPIEVRRGTERLTVTTTLEPPRQPLSIFEEKLTAAVLLVIMPLLCLALGGAAAAIRIRDRQAWVLLGLMLTFPQLVRQDIETWSGGVLLFLTIYRNAMLGAFPVAMILFSVYFAERLRLDERAPWLKWLLLIPCGLGGAVNLALMVFRLVDVAAWPAVQHLLHPLMPLFAFSLFVSISMFFATLAFKLGSTQNPDVRRRLKLLLVGTQVALGPMFVVVVISFVFRTRGLSFVPPAVLTAVLLLFFLFPATFAYVILVHRALDLRVVVRQGIQYALVRRGASVLMGLVVVGIMFWTATAVDDPKLRRPERFRVVAASVVAILVMQRLRTRAAEWIDSRFFRNAYDAERVLTEVSEQVRTMVEPGALVRTVAETISKTLYVPRLAFLLADGGVYRPAFAIGYEAPPPVEFPERAGTVEFLKQTAAPARVYLDDVNNWVWKTQGVTDDERGMLERLESQLILPLAVKEKLLGFISLGQKKSEEPYSGSDLRLLRYLAAQSALALQNTQLTEAYAREAAQREKLNREVEIAREVQERLFPQKLPSVEGLDCAGGCRPALAVGGDYYDFLALPEGQLGVVIGDVSGKGIAAALLMASLQASVRSQTIHPGQSLAAMIASVNTLIYEASTSSRYATLFYAQLDPKTLTLDYVNAGHNPPMLFRASGEVERLEVGGTVVGLLPRFPFRQARVQLQRGDLLVGFTDGVSEAENGAQEDWGDDRLIAAVRGASTAGASELMAHLMREADRFAAGAEQHDDMTLVILRVL